MNFIERKVSKTNARFRLFDYSIIRKSASGFTLVEMLVVIGIIAVLVGASVAGYSKMTKSAERAKIQELVRDTATALTTLFQTEGNWPKRLATAASGGDGRLDKDAALPLARGGYLSLTTDRPDNPKLATKLVGLDQFGVVTPWAAAVIKRRGTDASSSDKVLGSVTVDDHVLHFAIDGDGDGIIEAKVGSETVKLRATAAVWSIGKSGGDEGKPWPYSVGRKKDDVYSWSYGQTQDVD